MSREWALVLADLPPRVRQEIEVIEHDRDAARQERDEARDWARILRFQIERGGDRVVGLPDWLKEG